MFPNQNAIFPSSTNTKSLALHFPLISCSEDVNSKVETLDDNKDSNDEEENKKANMYENVSIVC